MAKKTNRFAVQNLGGASALAYPPKSVAEYQHPDYSLCFFLISLDIAFKADLGKGFLVFWLFV